MPFDLMFVRDDDIPGLVQDNLCTLGIVGMNEALEKKIEIENLEKASANFEIVSNLDFGQCKLSFAYPDDSPVQDLKNLEGKTVATSYPNIVSDYISKAGLNISVTQFSGAVELAPSLGKADLICDLVSTGSTLRMNDLKPIETILKSEAVLVANPRSLEDPKKREVMDRLRTRLQGNIQARQTKYVMMNAPEKSLDKIREILPGMRSPTVVPLAEEGMVAVHSAVPEEVFWDVIELLKKTGATDILVVPVEKMVT